jgi:hypothetical protein
MAVLTEQARDEVWAELMRRVPEGQVFPVDKVTLRALIAACDEVINDNAGSLNSQIQALNTQWNTLSLAMRNYVFTGVTNKRYGTGI